VAILTICTTAFAPLARLTAESLGGTDWPLAVIPHPTGGIGRAELEKRAEAAYPLVEGWLRQTLAAPAAG
jgi:hypothetical protein